MSTRGREYKNKKRDKQGVMVTEARVLPQFQKNYRHQRRR